MSIPLSSQFELNVGLPIEKSMVVADLTARDAIVTIKRFEGLMTYVVSEKNTYQLQGGIANTNWKNITAGTDVDNILTAFGEVLVDSNGNVITK